MIVNGTTVLMSMMKSIKKRPIIRSNIPNRDGGRRKHGSSIQHWFVSRNKIGDCVAKANTRLQRTAQTMLMLALFGYSFLSLVT
jgi:hypothetical protein